MTLLFPWRVVLSPRSSFSPIYFFAVICGEAPSWGGREAHVGPSRILKEACFQLPEIPSHMRTKYWPITRNETETDAVTQLLFLYEGQKRWVKSGWCGDISWHENCIPESHLVPPSREARLEGGGALRICKSSMLGRRSQKTCVPPRQLVCPHAKGRHPQDWRGYYVLSPSHSPSVLRRSPALCSNLDMCQYGWKAHSIKFNNFLV